MQRYAPYGAVRYSQGTIPTTYNYTGQRLDSETGLLYYGFRSYDPVVGRFVRADTTDTNAKAMDGYAYVGENPETKNDSTGHRFVSACGDHSCDNEGDQVQQAHNPGQLNPDLDTTLQATRFWYAWLRFGFELGEAWS